MSTTERARIAGRAAQAKRSPEQRSEIARMGAVARRSKAAQRVAEALGPLTPEQEVRLRTLLASPAAGAAA